MGSKASMTRPLDGLGRICLPREFRKTMGLGEGSVLECSSPAEDTIVLKVYRPGCIFCGDQNSDGYEFRDRFICADCWEELHQEPIEQGHPTQPTEPSQQPGE